MKAKIYNKKYWVENTDSEILKNLINEILYISNFTILNFQEHYFNPIGYTALWLLGESHCAIHTFPEENKSYIELSSCNRNYLIIFNKHIAQWENQY